MKFFFVGEEKINWALNEDIRLARESLGEAHVADSLEQADAVISPWWGGLEAIPAERLVGKRVVCQFDNPPYHWAKQPGFREARARVGLWIVQTEEARRQAEILALPHVLVPYKVDTGV